MGGSPPPNFDCGRPRPQGVRLHWTAIAVPSVGGDLRSWWAATYEVGGLDSRQPVTHRDLNWVAVAKAQRGPKAAMAFYPPSHDANGWQIGSGKPALTRAWEYVVGGKIPAETFPDGLAPWGVKLATFIVVMRICLGALAGSANQSWKKSQIDAALRLTGWFKSPTAVRQWVDKVTDRGALEFRYHDAAQALPAPCVRQPKNWWAGLILAAPAQISAFLPRWKEIEDAVGGQNAPPKTVAQLRSVCEAAGIPMTVASELSAEEFAFVAAHPHKTWEALPQVGWECGEYRLVKLSYNDPAQVAAGRLTDCCQHLAGAGRACAIAAWVQPEAAIYALVKGAKMVAQAFAWRSKNGLDVVFDSIEGLRNADESVVVESFASAAKQIVGQLGISQVLVPSYCEYGFTASVKAAAAAAGGKTVKTPKPAFRLSYTDADETCIVVASANGYKPMPSPVVALPPEEAVNVLQDGSGVFCEHCDAEVHPAAEICPACGGDISEWWVEEEGA